MTIERTNAMRAQIAHQFVPGVGYRTSGPLMMPTVTVTPIATNAMPQAAVVNGSMHRLQPPQGGASVVCRWIAAERAWGRPGGNRMAWAASYLSRAGWRYLGAA